MSGQEPIPEGNYGGIKGPGIEFSDIAELFVPKSPRPSRQLRDVQFEVAKDGLDRTVTIGDDSAAFIELMTLYFPDEEIRQRKILELLSVVIDRGRLKDVVVSLTPHDTELDLPDGRIQQFIEDSK